MNYLLSILQKNLFEKYPKISTIFKLSCKKIYLRIILKY